MEITTNNNQSESPQRDFSTVCRWPRDQMQVNLVCHGNPTGSPSPIPHTTCTRKVDVPGTTHTASQEHPPLFWNERLLCF